MTKNKNLFKNISLFLCLVPMLLLSLFCLVPKNETMIVSALDSSVVSFQFNSTNLVVPMSIINSNSTSLDRQVFSNVVVSFGFSGDKYNLYIGIDRYGDLDSSSPVIVRTEYSSSTSTTFGSPGAPTSVSLKNNSSYRYIIDSYINGPLSSEINRISFGSYKDSHLNWSSGGFYNFIRYYDINDNYISFDFYVYTPNNSDFYNYYSFQERTFYISLYSSSNNEYYESGYNDGYNKGFFEGNLEGYNDGYNVGESIGYNDGYNAGVETGGNYSFNSLIGAVIDAPVSAFTSLLNFEILGINILGFITGLLTLALIIFIIKLCMGGK